ncbi:ComEC/Rec2 family competence protein [Pedobacter planticolens]|uniref:ComEC/Rec2 family competence protein n=1 Tax=Pedobacter planticolens TaxID=2679964 RepID=UPI001603B01B|nr:MBL fold metallo-hydrolase [Pedobacter planticolens]
MNTEILILKAYQGDCILIKTFDENEDCFNILIDGGTPNTFDFSLRNELKDIAIIDLLVLTHIDSDHIGGVIKFLKNSLANGIEIRKYWVNCLNLIEVGFSSGKISYGQAKSLEELLLEKKEPLSKFNEAIFFSSQIRQDRGITITVLSPTSEIIDSLKKGWPELSEEYQKKLKEVKISGTVLSQVSKGSLRDLAKEDFRHQKTIENDIVNSSCIAMLIKGIDFSFLALGDSRAEVVEQSLRKLEYNDTDNKLKVDYVKISHHGSKNNTSASLLDLIESEKFIISTNGGGAATRHPDRETIARILFHPKRDFTKKVTIIFNYPLSNIASKSGELFTEDEMEDGNWCIQQDITNLELNDA